MTDLSPLGVFAAAFLLSGFAGLAALLRLGRAVTWWAALTYFLNCGLLGLGLGLLWYAQFRDNVYALVGLCVLAGLGGMATLEVVVGKIRKWLNGRNGDHP